MMYFFVCKKLKSHTVCMYLLRSKKEGVYSRKNPKKVPQKTSLSQTTVTIRFASCKFLHVKVVVGRESISILMKQNEEDAAN